VRPSACNNEDDDDDWGGGAGEANDKGCRNGLGWGCELAKKDVAAEATLPVPVEKRDGGGCVLGVMLWVMFGGAGGTAGVFGWGTAEGPASVDSPAVSAAVLSLCLTDETRLAYAKGT